MAHSLSQPHHPALEVLPFYCPVPSRQPVWDVAVLESRGLEWLDATGLCPDPALRERLARAEISRLAALTVPHGADEERVQIVTDLNLWYTVLDDTYGDGASVAISGQREDLFALLLRTLTAPEAEPATALDAALRDLRQRIGRVCGRAQVLEWIRAVQAYFQYELWEASRRSHGVLPSLDAYATYCADGRAAAASMAMLPIAGAYAPDEVEMELPTVRALTDMACVLACWDNDLYSYAKERRHCDGVLISLLPVLGNVLECAPEEAVPEAVALRDSIMTRFLRLRQQIRDRVSAVTARYLDDLALWIRGQLEWGLSSHRFADPAVRMPTDWAPLPRNGRLNPRTLPTMAWWWQVS